TETQSLMSEIFARIGRLIANGVPLLTALDATAADSSSPQAGVILSRIGQSLEVGRSLSGSFENAGIFPDALIEALRLAEDQGRLDVVLPSLAESIAKGDFVFGDPDEIGSMAKSDPSAEFYETIPNLVDDMINDAYRARASDLHIDPEPEGGKIRFRLDGVLQTQEMELNAEQHVAVISRIKCMANLDVAERKLPQDGRFFVKLARKADDEPRRVDLRVSICPFVGGEKAVMRFLDRANLPEGFETTGLNPSQIQQIQAWLQAPTGLILVSGPVGSGKTTTLYMMLRELAGREKLNVMSIEDPVEFLLPGVKQLQVQDAIGLTFTSGLRALLRQDPDVISVGEIRDVETARILSKVAHAGRLALSQLHSRDAVSTVKLLFDLGLPVYILKGIIVGVASQRLLRKLCPQCKEPLNDTKVKDLPAPYAAMKGELFKEVGCEHCVKTGYRGRVVIMELFEPKEDFFNALAKGLSTDELLKTLPGSHSTLRSEGLKLVSQGVTTISEVERVLG
ncbi:ATPase, T2SS/T4P/T4SS family, partial [Acidobacteriota bacterium]